ncbi:MAG: Rpp14/Pop5 family protein [Candidatus Hodarchaeota archaeon]
MKKQRRRYLLFHIHLDGPSFGGKQLTNDLRKNLHSLYGEVAVADSRLYINEYDEKSCTGILHCTSEMLEMVAISAVLLSQVGETRISFEPRKTSGTIRGLKQQLVKED